MKVLITGSNGNLGRHLIKHCKSHEIIPISRSEWPSIEAYMACSPDLIVHTAYDLKSSIHQSPHSLVQSNVGTTARLLELSARYGIKRFLFISSCAVYGHSSNSFEGGATIPVSFNGLTKLLNEQLILNFCSSWPIKPQLLRVFNTFGGDDDFSVVTHIERAVKNNVAFTLNNDGRAHRDFIHINDISLLISRLIDSDISFPIINIGTGKTHMISNIFEIALKHFPEIKYTQTFKEEVEFSRADTRRIAHFIDFQPIDLIDYINMRWTCLAPQVANKNS